MATNADIYKAITELVKAAEKIKSDWEGNVFINVMALGTVQSRADQLQKVAFRAN